MLPDNYDLFSQHDAEQEEKLKMLPICRLCEYHIQQDDVVKIGHAYYCDDCLKDSRVSI